MPAQALNRLREHGSQQLHNLWSPIIQKSRSKPIPQPQKSLSEKCNTERPLIVFPGGGIYFWWQAGAVKALQEMYDLDKAVFAGASAGAMSSVLAGCNVDMDEALEVAERLALTNDVWGRPHGLMGIWGSMIYEWLDEILPDNAAELCRGRVAVSVTSVQPTFPPLQRQAIDDFASKHDLIQACLASVHIPFFLDGKVVTGHRGTACVDGSLTFVLRRKPWHFSHHDQQASLIVHHHDDAKLMAHRLGFLQTISQKGFREMFEMGYRHMRGRPATAQLRGLGYTQLHDA